MIDWLRGHERLMWWLIAASIVTFAASVLAVPWMIVRLPTDYFARAKPPKPPFAERHPVMRILLVIGKNLLGVALIAAGILMLILPGQGVLTVLAGIVLLDVPGKHRMLVWLVERPAVLKSLNWIRKRAHKEPLTVRAR
jgi:hypothetical protein